MKKIIFVLSALAMLTSGCKKPVSQFENGFVGNWKFFSVTSTGGSVTTNPTTAEIITTFQENSNNFSFIQNGSQGSGTYSLSKNNGIAIQCQRSDFGGWPNGPWLNLFLDAINKSKSYQIRQGEELVINTSDGRVVLFKKL